MVLLHQRQALRDVPGLISDLELVKPSGHGLGHLLNPLQGGTAEALLDEAWRYLLAVGLGYPVAEPEWFGLPAVSRITGSTPRMLQAFRTYNIDLPKQKQVRPYNFLLSVQVAPFGHPEGVDPQRFHLVAPYSSDPGMWDQVEWLDLYSGRSFAISTTDDPQDSGLVLVRSYRTVLREYLRHLEAKSEGASKSGRDAIGLLQRRAVNSIQTSVIGKESNKLEEGQMGMLHRIGEALATYGRRLDPWEEYVRPVLHEIPARVLAEVTGLNERSIKRLRNGHARPRSANEARLTEVAVRWAGARLQQAGVQPPRGDLAILATYRSCQRDASS